MIVPDANGEPLTFYPSDIKAFDITMVQRCYFRFIGGRCEGKDPERDARNGRVVGSESV
ncbi:hypothetical protein OK016_17530 [Vibrio chagasii]|nr:hypothetical protein [Vibrio chagasii]